MPRTASGCGAGRRGRLAAARRPTAPCAASSRWTATGPAQHHSRSTGRPGSAALGLVAGTRRARWPVARRWLPPTAPAAWGGPCRPVAAGPVHCGAPRLRT